jgi:hypothetical protein
MSLPYRRAAAFPPHFFVVLNPLLLARIPTGYYYYHPLNALV